MDLGLKGKIALVTGAGSQIGFGKETALLLAREGCEAVAVTDVNLEDAEKTAGAVRKLGCKSIAVKADITSPAEVAAMVKRSSSNTVKSISSATSPAASSTRITSP